MFEPDSENIMIDAHVHLHDPAHAMDDLQQAFDNFSRQKPTANTAVIMLAERRGYQVFNQLKKQLITTEEDESLYFEHKSHRMLILAGRQIVTAEGLEILALASCTQLFDGLPVHQAIEHLHEEDALAVLPWGVGKWLGKRGKLIDDLIENSQPGSLFLGDNAGRPKLWGVPQFNSDLIVLPGSDPLPLNGSAQNIGCYGALMQARLSSQTPAAELKKLIRNRRTPLQRFGETSPALRFISDQLRLRLHTQTAVGNA